MKTNAKVIPHRPKPAILTWYLPSGIRTRNLILAYNILYHCTTLSIVFILPFLPIYYTKSSVNWLFAYLIMIQIKRLSTTKFFYNFSRSTTFVLAISHPRSFTKFDIHFVVCQIWGTQQSLVICRVPWSGTQQTYKIMVESERRTVQSVGVDSPPANVQTSEHTCWLFECPNILYYGWSAKGEQTVRQLTLKWSLSVHHRSNG